MGLVEDSLFDFTLAATKDRYLYLKHKPIAMVFALADFVNLFEYIVGLKEKKSRWRSIYESCTFEAWGPFENLYATVSQSRCPYHKISDLVNEFCNRGGLERLYSLLTWEKYKQVTQEVQDQRRGRLRALSGQLADHCDPHEPSAGFEDDD